MRYSGFHSALEIDHKAHQSDSWQIHLCNEIETDQLDRLRKKFKDAGLQAPSYTSMVIKAIAIGVEELKPRFPQLSSFIRKIFFWRKIHLFEGISAGCSVALDTEDAVAVGVVLEPQRKSLIKITEELAAFSDPSSAVVKNALTYYSLPKFIQAILYWFSKNFHKMRYENRGTYCLNPVGKFGVDFHLSLPQTSCLQFGMGTVRERVVAREGKPLVMNTFYLTVSFDRRIMNGRPAAILMDRVRTILNRAELREDQ